MMHTARTFSICVAIMCVFSFASGAEPDLSKGLIGHWTFDDKENPGKDDSGRAHHGTLKGPEWQQGEAESGILVFDGIDDYVDLGDIDEFEFGPKDSFTISLWVKPRISQEKHEKYGHEKAIRAFTFGRVNNSRNPSKCTWVIFNMLFPNLILGDGNRKSDSYPIHNGRLQYESWYHLAVVVGAEGETVTSYLNGVKTKTGKRTVGQLTKSDSAFRIGGEFDYYYFTGGIDDVRVYNRALSPEEILSLNAAVKKSPAVKRVELSTFPNEAVSVNIAGEDPNARENLTYKIMTPPANGTLTGEAPNLSYAPAKDFLGTDSFTFSVSDGNLDSVTATVTINTYPRAFPGAEGYGAVSVGGRGGKVIKVTNLDAQGPGSLQWACNQKGPKIIVFDVSGVITPKSDHKGRRILKVKTSNTTIAGQTAPAPGITINGVLSTERGDGQIHDIIIRFMRARPIASQRGNMRSVEGSHSKRLILDHVTGSWNLDECFEFFGDNSDITIQWCTVEESDVQLEKGDEPHNFGVHLGYGGPRPITFHHNLIANHHHRAPLVGGYPTDLRNNVLYNIGTGMRFLLLFRMGGADKCRMNVVGNYSKAGPAGLTNSRIYIPPYTIGCPKILPESEPRDRGHLFFKGNYFDWKNGYTESWRFVSRKPKCIASGEFDFGKVTTHTAEEAYKHLMAHAGCLPRDVVSQRTIREVETGTGGWGAFLPEGDWMQGYEPQKAPTDTDKDGMPDEWEKAHGLNPEDPADNTKIVLAGASKGDRHKGYTYIEFYINERADKLIAEAMAEYWTSSEPVKPWDQPAKGLSDMAMMHADLDAMLASIRNQNLALHIDPKRTSDTHDAWFAVQRLSRMGEKAKSIIPELMKLVTGEDARQAQFAAWALGAMGPAAGEATSALITCVEKEWSAPKRKFRLNPSEFAAWALGRIGLPAAKDALPALLAFGARGKICIGGEQALIYAISRLVDETSVEAIPILVQKAKNYHAPYGLARIGKPAIPALTKVISKSREAQSLPMIKALGLMGNKALSAVPAVMVCLKHDHPFVRAQAAWALGRISPESKEVIKALSEGFSDTEMNVRHASLKALALSGEAALDVLTKIESAFLKDGDREVQAAAAEALTAMGGKAVPVFTKALTESKSAFIKKHAIRGLARISAATQDASAVPVLIRTLSDQDAQIRCEGVWALGLMGPVAKDALSVLKDAEKGDPDCMVRFGARTVVNKINR